MGYIKLCERNQYIYIYIHESNLYLRQVIYILRLSWLGRICNRFAKQISKSVQKCYFPANLWVVFNTKPILRPICKDFLPLHHNFLNYLFKRSYVSRYIGRTNQRLDARIKQHVPTKIRNFNVTSTNNLKNIYWSSIAKHLIRNCVLCWEI